MSNFLMVDQCDECLHKFVKLPDHPKHDGKARCPYCMAIGLDAARAPKPDRPMLSADQLPILSSTLLNLIGEYGLARTEGASELERIHRWELLISGIKDYTVECIRADREGQSS